MLSRRLLSVLPLLASILLLSGCKTDPGAYHQVSLEPNIELELVRFRSADGLSLSGRVFGDGKIGIILSHAYLSDQQSWTEIAKNLSRRGYAVLTFNHRGYGLSDGVKDIRDLDLDILAAVDWFSPEREKIFVIGAGMGGTAALKAAAKGKIDGVATLSAPARFRGLEGGSKIGRVKGVKLFMASLEDREAAKAARAFYVEAGEPKEIQLLPGHKTGSEILENPSGLGTRTLTDWLLRAIDRNG